MKKIILSALFALCLSVTHAQSVVTTMKSSYSLNSDTVTDAGSAYVQLQVTGCYQQVSVQVVVTRLSGTVNAPVYLQASIDGANFLNVSSTDTLHATTGTVTHVWIVNTNPYLYYRLSITGQGTMAATIAGYTYPTGQGGTAHVSTFMKSQYSLNSDTVTNSATKYLTLQVKKYYGTVTMQAVVTKLSGTAGGTVTLQGSNDGTNYETVNTNYSTAQTLSVTNVTTSTKLFVITGSPYNYYRFKYVGTGTMACTIKGYLLPSLAINN